jgi:FlaA1/EpsC-like NDP-sugar epimerase
MTLSEFEFWYKKRYRRTTSAITVIAMIIADIIGVLLSFGAGFFLVNLYDMGAINFRSFVTYWPYVPIFILIFQMFALYPGIALAPAEELRHFTTGCLITFGGIIITRYIEDQELDAISIAFFIGFLLSTFILLLCRSVMRGILSMTKLGGIPAVIYGGGTMGKILIDKLLDNRWLGHVPVLILDDDVSVETYRDVPIIHDTSLGMDLVKKFNIKMAIVAMSQMDEKKLARLLTHSVSAFRYNVLVPSFFGITNVWMNIRDFSGPMILTMIGLALWRIWLKRINRNQE